MACTLCHRNSLKQNDKKIFNFLKEYTYLCQNLLLFVLLVIPYMFQITTKTKQNKKIILLFLVSLIHRLPDNDISPTELINIFNLISLKFFSTKKLLLLQFESSISPMDSILMTWCSLKYHQVLEDP